MQSATTRVYYEESYQFTLPAKLLFTSQDDRGSFALFDQTIFHPQGGGQPADAGVVSLGDRQIVIQHVALVGEEIRHYGDFSNIQDTCSVVLTIDESKRRQFASLHSGGHLIAHLVEQDHPTLRACKGHHFPDGPHVEFLITDLQHIPEISVGAINQRISALLLQQQPVTIVPPHPEQPKRMIQLGDFPATPCGGTHVQSIAELEGLKVMKIKKNKGKLKISYQIQA